jgi:hypothetical protein
VLLVMSFQVASTLQMPAAGVASTPESDVWLQHVHAEVHPGRCSSVAGLACLGVTSRAMMWLSIHADVIDAPTAQGAELATCIAPQQR